MEGLNKHKQQRSTAAIGMPVSKPFSTVKYKNEVPNCRLYKSEPKLTVAEVDEPNGEKNQNLFQKRKLQLKVPNFLLV